MKKSLRDKIYKKLKTQITQGLLSPDERLIEDRLTREFKASRSPIREALRLLESEGLLTLERNRGISVAKLSIKQVDGEMAREYMQLHLELIKVALIKQLNNERKVAF